MTLLSALYSLEPHGVPVTLSYSTTMDEDIIAYASTASELTIADVETLNGNLIISRYRAGGCGDMPLLTELVVPNLISLNYESGTPVYSVGSFRIKGAKNLTSISFPNLELVTRNFHIQGCSKLTSVSLPNLTQVGRTFAIVDCPNLTSLTLPSSFTSLGKTFSVYGCGLDEASINDSIILCSNQSPSPPANGRFHGGTNAVPTGPALGICDGIGSRWKHNI